MIKLKNKAKNFEILKKNKTSHITNFLNSIKDKLNIYCMRTSTFWYKIDDFQDYKNLKNLKW